MSPLSWRGYQAILGSSEGQSLGTWLVWGGGHWAACQMAGGVRPLLAKLAPWMGICLACAVLVPQLL